MALGMDTTPALQLRPDIKRHEVSAAWPDDDSEIAVALAASVQAQGAGPAHPIILTAGPGGQPQVLDGWHRVQEYRRAGIQDERVPIKVYAGDDPTEFVTAPHLAVRRLSVADPAEAAIRSFKAAGMLRGRSGLSNTDGVTNDGIANPLGISVSGVTQPGTQPAAPKSWATPPPAESKPASKPKTPTVRRQRNQCIDGATGEVAENAEVLFTAKGQAVLTCPTSVRRQRLGSPYTECLKPQQMPHSLRIPAISSNQNGADNRWQRHSRLAVRLPDDDHPRSRHQGCRSTRGDGSSAGKPRHGRS